MMILVASTIEVLRWWRGYEIKNGWVNFVSMVESILVKKLSEAVEKNLRQDYPKFVLNVSLTLGFDHDGDEAFFVNILLNDKKRKEYGWKDVAPLDENVRQTIARKVKNEPFRFPYVNFQFASEQVEEEV